MRRGGQRRGGHAASRRPPGSGPALARRRPGGRGSAETARGGKTHRSAAGVLTGSLTSHCRRRSEETERPWGRAGKGRVPRHDPADEAAQRPRSAAQRPHRTPAPHGTSARCVSCHAAFARACQSGQQARARNHCETRCSRHASAGRMLRRCTLIRDAPPRLQQYRSSASPSSHRTRAWRQRDRDR